MRSSVFENNVSRYSVVINTVSDCEISSLHYYTVIWSGSFLNFSLAVSAPIQIRFSRLQFMKVRSTCAAKILIYAAHVIAIRLGPGPENGRAWSRTTLVSSSLILET